MLTMERIDIKGAWTIPSARPEVSVATISVTSESIGTCSLWSMSSMITNQKIK